MSVSENDVQNSLILFSAQRLTRFFLKSFFLGIHMEKSNVILNFLGILSIYMRREFALLFFFPEIDFETYLKIQLKQDYFFPSLKGLI